MIQPVFEQQLPDLHRFARRLATAYQCGELTGWPQFREICMAFYTPEQMTRIEQVVPGWQKMAGYANRQTLIHVSAALTALFCLPEYEAAAPAQRRLAEWIVLFHDITKEPQPGKRDHVHGFRSAVLITAALPGLGFAVQPHYASELANWSRHTYDAITYDDRLGDYTHDNRQLPAITAGLDRLLAGEAALIAYGVLLHMSITVVPDWPASAPLSDSEIRRYVSRDLLPLLRLMFLVDNMAWALFEPDRRAAELAATRAECQRIERQLLL
jgi:hypothetical protein